MTVIRAILAIVGLVVVSLVLIPLQYLAMALKSERWMRRLPLWWHRAAVKLVGIRVHVHGGPAESRPLLLIANHVSWLDIMVLGSVMELSFISKAEVAKWPIFGLFAKLQRSVFVERDRRSKTADVTAEIAERLGKGDVLVLFGEGTSSNGIHVLPFRTALVGGVARVAQQAGGGAATIQPLAVNYTQLQGVPMGRFYKPRVAWYGDMDMAGHLWWVLCHGVIDVDVMFADPIPFDGKADRKQTVKSAEETVRRLVGEATAGRVIGQRKKKTKAKTRESA